MSSTSAPVSGWRRARSTKASATEHIKQARSLVTLLEHKDIRVEMLTTERPGYIVYEDRYQVVAMPFDADTL